MNLISDREPVLGAAGPKRPPVPAHILHSKEEAIEIAHRLAAEFAVDGAERDQTRRLPWDELDRFSQSGLYSMNVPKEAGGPGLSYETVARVFAILAAGDASIAQIAQNHISLIDIIRLDPDPVRRAFLFDAALSGLRFGNALAERSSANARDIQTRIVRHGDHYVLNGKKFYATGALYAHIVPVYALDEAGKGVTAFIDRDSQGVTVIDDWSGFGQKTTGSGTVILDNVPVPGGRLVPSHLAYDVPTVHGPVSQILHAAIDAGIARRAVEETVDFVKNHARPWPDSGKTVAAEDPFTIRDIADLQIKLHAAEALLWRAGRAIDAGLKNENADTVAAASIAVAEAKILTTEIALFAATKLFELAGTRSVLDSLGLDRFWRDARVHTLHDPVRWKFYAIGDYVLNGTKPPRHTYI